MPERIRHTSTVIHPRDPLPVKRRIIGNKHRTGVTAIFLKPCSEIPGDFPIQRYPFPDNRDSRINRVRGAFKQNPVEPSLTVIMDCTELSQRPVNRRNTPCLTVNENPVTHCTSPATPQHQPTFQPA